MPATDGWNRDVARASDIRVGQRVLGSWRDGSEREAEILDQRPQNVALRRRGVPFVAPSDLPLDEREYYLHYKDQDKRLDEWVQLSAIVAAWEGPAAGPSSSSSSAAAAAASAASAPRARKRRQSKVRAEGKFEAMEREHQEATRIKNIQSVQFGRWEVDCWYYSPYPDDYAVDRLYLCEHSLRYFRRLSALRRHEASSGLRGPPGERVYRDRARGLVVFEVDGRSDKEFCQNLCLLAKLFLDHKTLYFDVDPFLFYVLCEEDDAGVAHLVGYFSKEKHSPDGFNLSCILTLPPYQRKGYGTFLISLSYELSKREGRTGSPERPLSDLGKVSYQAYWAHVVLAALAADAGAGLTIRELSAATRVRVEDIVSTLQELGLVKLRRGQHMVRISEEAVRRHVIESRAPESMCRPECLTWEPPAKGAAAGAKARKP